MQLHFNERQAQGPMKRTEGADFFCLLSHFYACGYIINK